MPGEQREHVEAKYDTATFLDKARDTIEVDSAKASKQPHSYEMVVKRTKPATATPMKTKGLVLFIAEPIPGVRCSFLATPRC